MLLLIASASLTQKFFQIFLSCAVRNVFGYQKSLLIPLKALSIKSQVEVVILENVLRIKRSSAVVVQPALPHPTLKGGPICGQWLTAGNHVALSQRDLNVVTISDFLFV